MRLAKIKTIDKTFELKLQELYDIEKQIEKALTKMVHKAATPLLSEGFATHLEETRGQISRLEEAFTILQLKPKKLRSEGIRGIILDGEGIADLKATDEVMDTMLASAARYVEHFEMAGYMTAIAQARLLGLTQVEELLKQNLAEEESTDKKLAQIAKELSGKVGAPEIE
ncbi:MAG TPA: DUF892 family protein [Candidatus Paceibacterota bacterium]